MIDDDDGLIQKSCLFIYLDYYYYYLLLPTTYYLLPTLRHDNLLARQYN